MLFDLKFFKTLKLLNIITKRHFRGEKIGHRKSLNRGASIEFAEYRDYLPGDDLRFLDWNIYGRLEKLCIKKFHNEEEIFVSVLLDSSSSMSFGEPQKFDHARKIAAAIAYISLQHQDSVRLYTFSNSLEKVSDLGVRLGHIHRLMGFLEDQNCSGSVSSFDEVVQHFLVKNKRPGVVFILSDGFLKETLYEGLKRFSYRHFEVNFVQILSLEEVNPPLAGLIEIVDGENQSKINLQVTKQALTAYEEILSEEIEELKSFLHRLGMNYYKSLTNTPFESTLLGMFDNSPAEPVR